MTNNFILQVQEQRRPEVVHELKVHWFNTIKDVKRLLETIVNFPADRLRILLASTMQVLQNTQVLSKLPLPAGEPSLIVSYGFGISGGYKIEGAKGISYSTESKEMLRQVQQGLNRYTPGKTDGFDCTGGVYFMKSTSGNIVGVFKPQDEEQGMPNNPKGHAGNGTQGLRPHFKPGDGYLREYAAYLMDHENFCSVPATTIASCEHPVFSYSSDKDKGTTFPKVGSLQRYVRANDTFDDISSSLLSVFEVQKIALLDMRILNCDRNGANILAVRKEYPHSSERRNSRGESLSSVGELNDVELDVLDFMAGSSHFKESSRPADTYELIPIDHGYSLPTRLQIDDFDWVWYSGCEQVQQPVDPRIRAYLNRLNFDELMAKVTAEVALSEDTIYLLRTVHELLVQGVNAGLTLYEIASLIVRVEDNVPSALEKLLARAEENAYSTMEVRDGHRYQKVTALENVMGSPVRRGKSPTTIFLSSTPPRVSELLQMKRMVKSEYFPRSHHSLEEEDALYYVQQPQHRDAASTDDGRDSGSALLPPLPSMLRPVGDHDESGTVSSAVVSPARGPAMLAHPADDDYFVKDIVSGEPSPQIPLSSSSTKNTQQQSPLYSSSTVSHSSSSSSHPSFALQGQPLMTMKTLDSAGLSLFMNQPQTKTTSSNNNKATVSPPVSHDKVNNIHSGEVFSESYDGFTQSEASSYESVGPSPRSQLFVNNHVPSFGASPTYFQQTASSTTDNTIDSTNNINSINKIVHASGLSAALAMKQHRDNNHVSTRDDTFEACEVHIFQPMVFEKVPATRTTTQQSSASSCPFSEGDHDGYDSTTDMDQGSSVASTPSERMFEQLCLHDRELRQIRERAAHANMEYSNVNTPVKTVQYNHLHQNNAHVTSTVEKTPISAFSSENLQALPMARVSSFNALESPPLYSTAAGDGADENAKRPHRLMRHLRREKRKRLSKNVDFLLARGKFASHYVKKLIANARLRSDSF